MSSRLLTALVYLAFALALVVTEIVARRSPAVPRLAELVRWAARRRSAQFGLVLLWWWLGWHFILAA